MMTMWHGSGWAWWQVGLMWFAMVVVLVLVVWAVYALVTSMARPGPAGSGGPDSPQRILSERLARGEIDATEYRRLQRLLEDGTSTEPFSR